MSQFPGANHPSSNGNNQSQQPNTVRLPHFDELLRSIGQLPPLRSDAQPPILRTREIAQAPIGHQRDLPPQAPTTPHPPTRAGASQPTFVRRSNDGREIALGTPLNAHPTHAQAQLAASENRLGNRHIDAAPHVTPNNPPFLQYLSTGEQLEYFNRIRHMTPVQRMMYERQVAIRVYNGVARTSHLEGEGTAESPWVLD